MELFELLDLYIDQSMKIDSLWNIFIGVHIVLLGGLVYIARQVTGREKIIAFSFYSLFMFMNLTAMDVSQDYLSAIITDINRLYGDSSLEVAKFHRTIGKDFIQQNVIYVIYAVYFFVYVVMGLTISNINRISLHFSAPKRD